MTDPLPLAGIRVIELGHVVMGSTCGLVLADMGADVVKIEKVPDGDDTRRLGGFGVGLFHFFNRNKRSLAIDLKSEDGKAILRRAIAEADVFIENFGPGAVERLGFGYDACAALNPGLIYCSLKGFMPGPYEHRPSLDNLVQMMGGLAYMTGPRGRPLRAGASVSDIMGGSYGALGILAALYERRESGQGQNVTAALFEATAFLVGQHMATAAIAQRELPPMPEGDGPWAVYDLFETRDGAQFFVGIVSERQWAPFCRHLGLDELAGDAGLASNEGRLARRAEVLQKIQARIGSLALNEVVAACDTAGIPFAPVNRPQDLYDDPQLVEGGGLVETRLADGRTTRLPKIPVRLGEHDFGLRHEPPRVGQGSREVLGDLGLGESEIADLLARGIVAIDED
ncbi:MAG TPA: CaiB/BaiF CoA-transferase family protein [Alphaproteobacteria bacterium]|jgi:crotonobetainyl-CoA:carnitine CoA-transferase CaiB-like acyl-CoA transferase|nr:CaiB/BaiF CoA-transferase family protein [Alphaproteobacteria bacterium]MDP6271235.1 CaiB/BaiF CoA-transferase family protein [Alphaproteobacteria bacterium]HJM50865.1 CaiB/BaiF CoA-transferase family protein [Alphaproteobacteria bacterium]